MHQYFRICDHSITYAPVDGSLILVYCEGYAEKIIRSQQYSSLSVSRDTRYVSVSVIPTAAPGNG